MTKKSITVKHLADLQKSTKHTTYAPLSKSVCAAMLAGAMVLGGGVFVSPAPAYADGYVSGDGARVYYGYKADADYSKERLLIKVTYYKTKDDALNGEDKGVDPLGKFVRVEYTSNNPEDANQQPDKWALRPTWWFGVPNGLKADTISQIRLVRNERGTQEPSSSSAPGAKRLKDASRQGYVVASDHTYNSIDQWKHSVSRDYYSGNETIDGKGWQRMVGITKNDKDYDNSGNTKNQWNVYKNGSANGLQGIFVDWESAGQRYYEMSYVAEMTDDAWKQRDQKPLLFVAGIYRGVGNWRYAAGTTMRAPKIADNLKLEYPKPTPVKNLGKLDSDEQAAVKKAINDANKSKDKDNPNLFDKLVAENGVSVDTKGNATITFTDGTKRVMPASLLVLKNETDKDKYKPTLPARTPVVKLSKLTNKEKTTVTQAIINANGGSTPNAFLQHVKKTSNQYEIRVQDDGSAKVTYADGSELTIPAKDLVYQGATIADWAPYRVPVPTAVDDPSQALTQEQKTAIASAFDEANKSFPVYQAAKTHNNSTSPVTFDNKNNAVITWADGSQTTIPAWMFLKKKQTQSTKPEQKQTTKEFTVDLPQTPTEVNFDPFDTNATVDPNQLTNLEASLQALTAKDASDSNKTVALTSAKISIADGTVTFKAKGYADKVYPIGIFYKKKVTGSGTQNPTTQTPTSKTYTESDNNKNTYTYFVTKTQISEAKVSDVTAQEAVKALKQFVKDNYTGWTEQDLEHVTSNVAISTSWKAKTGTKNLEPYNNGNGRITSISVNTNDNGLTVTGYRYADQEDAEIDASTDGPLFTISANDLYTPNSGSQNPTDNTVEKLKALAKKVRDEKKQAGVTDKDFKRAGIDDPATSLTDDAIGKMTDSGKLRDLIKKLSEAKHADRTYNSIGDIVVDDPTKLTEDDFKKAVEAFIKANYDNSDKFNANTVPTTLPTDLTPKSGTIDMKIADDNIKSVTSSETDGNKDYKSMVFKDNNGKELFSVAISYKKKEETPKLSDAELKEMRKQAKETIDHNPNLTKTDKKGFDDRIDTANTAEEIQKILKEAAEKAGENAKSVDPAVSNEISGNQNGTDAENQQKLDAAKEAAKDIISKLPNLSDEEKKNLTGKVTSATDINGVNSVVDEAKKLSELNGVKDEAQKAKFVFLDHGKGGDADSSDPNHTEDAALNKLLHGTPAEDQTLTTLAEKLKEGSNATASEIRAALEAAKQQNNKNEAQAKDNAKSELDDMKQNLDAAYNALTDDQKKTATEKYNAATAAIETAKTTVDSATKPSDITGALSTVNTALTEANTAVENAKGERNTSGNTNDQDSELAKEKKAAHERVNKTNLSPEEKKQYNDAIDASTKLGDPIGIANRAEKHQKIEDAKKQIDKLTHLNKAQKQHYKDLLDSTDASDHADGKDDIDDALEQALNLNGVMKRLADLATSADTLKNDDKDKKYSSADNDKKSAFDAALKAANIQLDKVDDAESDNINADGANALYDKLLEAMKALDSSVKGVGLYTDDLQAEYIADVALKNKPVYKNATNGVKEAFDNALNAAQTALSNATNNPTALGDTAAAQQNAIGAALVNLVNARKALDGKETTPTPDPTPTPSVDKSHLQQGINGSGDVKKSDDYTNAPSDKKQAYDHALDHANEVNNDPNATQDQVNQAAEDLKKAENDLKPAPTPSVDKSGLQKEIGNEPNVKNSDEYNNAPSDKKQAYDHALDHANEVNNNPNATQDQVNQAAEDLKKAEHDLKPAPTPSVDKSHLQQGINGSDDVHNSDDYTNAPSDKKQAYDHALDHANEVNKDPNATQDQVNQAAEDLKNAQKDLHDSATVDKSHLQSEVSDDVAFRARGSYLVADAPHKDAYNAALSEARRVLADPNATQAQVNAALSKLREAKRNILQANGLSGDEYAGDGNTGTGNTGTGNTGAGNTGTVPGSSVVPGTVPGTVPGSGDSGFGSTGTTNAGTSNAGTTNSGVAGSGHEGDTSLGFGVNDNAPTTVDKGELNLQIQGAESDSQSANAGNAGVNSGNAGSNNAANAGNAGANNTANANNAGANAGNAGANNAANAGNAGANAAANNNAAVTAAVENNPAVKQADAQVAAAQAALDSALAEAKKVAADHNATQAQVDAAKRKLADARKNLADAQAHAAQVRASVRAQVLKSGKVAQLSNTGSAVSALSTFAATIAAAGAALFVSKRRGTSRHSSK